MVTHPLFFSTCKRCRKSVAVNIFSVVSSSPAMTYLFLNRWFISLNHKADRTMNRQEPRISWRPVICHIFTTKGIWISSFLLEELAKMRLLPGLPPFYGYREDSFVTPWSLRVMWDFYAHITPLSPLVGEQLWVMGYSSCHTLFISSQNSEASSSIESDCGFS